MKTLILSAIFFAMTITSGFAGSTNAGATVRKQIIKQISFPQNTLKENYNEKATVTFTVKGDGNLVVNYISTSDENLKEHIIKNFESIKLEILEKGGTDTTYTMEIKFKVQ